MTETKEGYKYINGIGLIPEEWEVKKLEQLFNFYGGLSISRNKQSEKGVFYLHYGDIHKKNKNNFNVNKDFEWLPKIDIDVSSIKKQVLLQNGDIVFADASEDYQGIGKSIVVFNENNKPFVSGLHTIVAKEIKKSIDNSYKKYCFKIDKVKKQIRTIATGATVLGISKNNIKRIKILIPPLKEQQKIASILSSWDEAIEKTEKRIEEKKLQKKALMQKLLSEEKRLKQFKSNEWKELKLKDFLKQASRSVQKPSTGYKAIGIRSYGKGTFDKYVDDPTKVAMATLYEVKENDLIVNITFAWEGAIAIVKKSDEGKLVSHRFPTYEFNTNKVIPEFFKYIIIQPRFTYLLGVISPGGAGRNKVMSKKNFMKLKVKLPCVEEQKAIAKILNTADEEIELLEQKLEELKIQKKGLMQLLLTGKKRIKA